MPVRSCRVTIRDIEGVEHAVQVTASTLYEAVALGLVSFRSEEWVAGIPERSQAVKVSVTNVPVEHSVTMRDFNAWLLSEGRSPRDKASRYRVGEILRMLTQK
jgi:hypothetical protein